MRLHINDEVIKKDLSYPSWENIKGKDVESVKELFREDQKWFSSLDSTGFGKGRCLEFVSSDFRALVFFKDDVAIDYFVYRIKVYSDI